jgi:hypothetical protein
MSIPEPKAEVVRCWLLTAETQVQSWVDSSDIRVGRSGKGAGFLRVLRFPC